MPCSQGGVVAWIGTGPPCNGIELIRGSGGDPAGWAHPVWNTRTALEMLELTLGGW